MNDKINSTINVLPPFKRFCMTIGELPASYLETMSYYETLLWFTKYLQETVIPTINNNALAVSELQELFVKLQDYVNNYFDNLDVQEEINNKLDEMVDEGTLQEIISQYLNATAMWCFDTINDLKNATNLIDGSYAKTLGYYEINDGGSGIYKIRNKEISDVEDSGKIIFIGNNLVGNLISINGIYNVKQFGCYGDDEHNDTSNFQNCIDKSLGCVYIPKGIYQVSNIVINKTLKFYGEGIESEIKSISNNTHSAILEITNDGLNNSDISNFYLHGNKNNNESNITGIKIWCNDEVKDRFTTIHDITVRFCTGNGIHFASNIGDNDVKEMRLNNIRVANNNENGLYVQSASDCYFFEISAHGNIKHGLFIKGGNHKINNCKCYWNGEGVSGIYEDINRLPDQAFTQTEDTVYNSSKTYYIKNNLVYNEFTGSSFSENTTYYELTTNYQKRYAGFMLQGARNIITGCEAQENYGDGFYVYASNVVLNGILGDTNGILTDSEGHLVSYASRYLQQLYYGAYIRGGRNVNISGNFLNLRVETIGRIQKAPIFITSANYVSYNIVSDDNVINNALYQSGNRNTTSGICNNKNFINELDLSTVTFTSDTLYFYNPDGDGKSYMRKIGNVVYFRFVVNDTSGTLLSNNQYRSLFNIPSEFRPTENFASICGLSNNSGSQITEPAVFVIYKTGGCGVRTNNTPSQTARGVVINGSYVINSFNQ